MSEKQRKKHIILIEIRSEYNEKHLPLMIRNFKKLNKEIQENACQLLHLLRWADLKKMGISNYYAVKCDVKIIQNDFYQFTIKLINPFVIS